MKTHTLKLTHQEYEALVNYEGNDLVLLLRPMTEQYAEGDILWLIDDDASRYCWRQVSAILPHETCRALSLAIWFGEKRHSFELTGAEYVRPNLL